MAKTNKYVPAFPRPYSHDERPSGGFEGDRPETFPTQDGMDLRDYFAAKAMQGVLSNPDLIYPGKDADTQLDITSSKEAISKFAYSIADIMMKERDRS